MSSIKVVIFYRDKRFIMVKNHYFLLKNENIYAG